LISNFVDALDCTVSTLTTTGFGDIVMIDPADVAITPVPALPALAQAR
jgi:hypothetical protein